MKALCQMVVKLWQNWQISEMQVKGNGQSYKVMTSVSFESSWVYMPNKKYEVFTSYGSKAVVKVKVFRYVGQKPMSRSVGQNFWHNQKDLITRNVHMKYESYNSNGSKVMVKVIVFRNEGQTPWSRLESHQPQCHLKGFISWVYMPNRKSLSLMVQKLWPRLKFFATELQTDRTKTRCPRIPFKGHKNMKRPSISMRFLTPKKMRYTKFFNEDWKVTQFLISGRLKMKCYCWCITITSVLKILLKQYMSHTGPNKYLRGITTTKTDELKLDLFKVKIWRKKTA